MSVQSFEEIRCLSELSCMSLRWTFPHGLSQQGGWVSFWTLFVWGFLYRGHGLSISVHVNRVIPWIKKRMDM